MPRPFCQYRHLMEKLLAMAAAAMAMAAIAAAMAAPSMAKAAVAMVAAAEKGPAGLAIP